MIASALAIVLTAYQVNALNIAYNEGQKYGIPIYIQAIILTESSACLHRRGDDGNSFGCGQLQIRTAKTICRCKITRDSLTNNNSANIRISAAFLNQCFLRFWPDRNRALLCYNLGTFKAATLTNHQVTKSKYVARVLYWVRRLHEIKVSYE